MPLRLDWVNSKAARFAVERYHYSRKMPVAKSAYIGVWEDQRYVGALVFGLGGGAATDGRRWGLARQFEVVELERVALKRHRTPVSRIVAIALRMIKMQFTKLKLVISYADPYQGHHGGIYQAGNWIYVGEYGSNFGFKDKSGRIWHSRVVGTGERVHYGKRVKEPVRVEDCIRISLPKKHCYLMPLDQGLEDRLRKLSKPYPKRQKDQAPGHHPGLGGETPTLPLQPSR